MLAILPRILIIISFGAPIDADWMEKLRDSLLTFSAQLDMPRRSHLSRRLTYFYRQHEPFREKYVSNKRSIYQIRQRIQRTRIWICLVAQMEDYILEIAKLR